MSMKIIEDKAVKKVFEVYPARAVTKTLALRRLVIETSRKIKGIELLEESLKWGEPSYRSSAGSPLRIAWKVKSPDQYALYVSCSTNLIATFRYLYDDVFQFEGKRGVIFQNSEKVASKELKHCIALALTYHKKKQYPEIWQNLESIV